MTTRVILIDDERAMRESIAQWLTLADCEITTFYRSNDAIATIKPDFAGVVVTDLRMPDIDGMGVLESVLTIDVDIPVILITGHGDVNSAVDAMRQGAYDFIEKPFEPTRLLSTINRAMEKRDLILQNRALRQQASSSGSLEERLIGDCTAMRKIRDEVKQFADIDVNVLLIGETGTGKEIVAQCLHDFSSRNTKAFNAIDCGALSPERIEQELFGEAGADGRLGPFERACGGTVFLDEVTNMPLDQQTKLLRVLEEREVQRVGASEANALDFRLLSAADSTLAQALEGEHMRKDLYFRLNTIEMKLPPLKNRDNDCVRLFEHFTRKACQLYQREMPTTSSQDITALRTHDWPGNVRELKNVAERFVLYQTLPVQEVLQSSDTVLRRTLTDQVQAFEKSVIEYALAQCSGNISEVADYLGIPRRTLNDKLQRHEIDRDRHVVGLASSD